MILTSLAELKTLISCSYWADIAKDQAQDLIIRVSEIHNRLKLSAQRSRLCQKQSLLRRILSLKLKMEICEWKNLRILSSQIFLNSRCTEIFILPVGKVVMLPPLLIWILCKGLQYRCLRRQCLSSGCLHFPSWLARQWLGLNFNMLISLELLSMVIEERDYAPKELQELANIPSSN